MKFKPKLITILLILLVIYFSYQVYAWNSDKEDKWISCEEISKEQPDSFLYTEGTEAYNNANIYLFARYTSCLDTYSDIFMMHSLMQHFLIISILLVILSWKLDNLKKIN